MTFDLTNGLRSRIDRAYEYDDYWVWGFPDLQPHINFSLVVDAADNGCGCFVKGQNSFYTQDPSVAEGFTDPYLTDYLVHQTRQFALPWLLIRFLADAAHIQVKSTVVDVSGETYSELVHETLGLSLLVNTTNHIPYAVRSMEQHLVFGNSTNDVLLVAWKNVQFEASATKHTVMLPHRLQTVYNSMSVLEDFIIDSILVNGVLQSDFFATKPAPKGTGGGTNPQHPATSPEYPRSEVHEFFESGLWSGPFTDFANVSDVVVDHPVPGLKEIMNIWVAYADYVQVLVEFEDGLLITDAAPHRSTIILEWVKANMNGKKITHVVPSHHHRDHAGGVADYVAAGATLVIPEIALELYNFTGSLSAVETYTAEQPFVVKDDKVEFRSFWKVENPHAVDWTFGIANAADTSVDSDFVVFNADVISPGTDATRWDTGPAREFLIQCVAIGLPPGAKLVGAHGSSHGGHSTSEELGKLARTAGFDYPPLSADDYHTRND